ncbi:MAG: SUMF1/EgtB/PvdO family nonheme iron enzyme, partial [bacterium]|nr:SUMF1/EgtB/PvdO family nonheme iron enzyme [bacterium]
RDEQPQNRVLLNAYWIDRYPVTNRDYKAFVDATDHRAPPHWKSGNHTFARDLHPVTNVNWEDAATYARWSGKRLLTEAEWEKAARGTVGQNYPWGDTFRKDNVNSSNDYEGTTPINQFPEGASPYGVMDMCGNVQEWCTDWYYDDMYTTSALDNPTGPQGGQYRVCRGGFYAENKAGVRCSARHFAPPSTMQDHIGFRCAVSPGEKIEPLPAKQSSKKPKKAQKKKVEISADTDLWDIVADYPENVAKVARTLLVEAKDQAREEGEDSDGLSAADKLAVFMIALGQNRSAEIMKYLNDHEIERISQAITEQQIVPRSQEKAVLEEMKQFLVAGDYVSRGGIDFARGTLEKALGPRKAQALLDRVTSTTASGFYMLRNVAPEQIIPFISKEHPQTIALILSQLDTKQAAMVLSGLHEEMRSDIAYRISQMETISPQVLRELEDTLAHELRTILTGQITQIGGPKAVAEILGQTDPEIEKAVMKDIKQQDAESANAVSKARSEAQNNPNTDA